MESPIKNANDLIMDSILAYQSGDLQQSESCIRDAIESKLSTHLENILAQKYCPQN